MKVGMEKNKKIVMFMGAVLFLGLIVVGIIVVVVNSDGRKLANQLELGQKYLNEMDYEQAVVTFEAAIKIDPMNVEAYIGVADAYMGLEDIELAIAVLEEGYELTGNEEIQRKLDELYDGMAKMEDMEVKESIIEGENIQEGGELSYFEIGFSPEDFTIAGYSVMDGNHLEDVAQALAAEMPEFGDSDEQYTQWFWNKVGDELYEGLHIVFFDESDIGWLCMEYCVDNSDILLSVYNCHSDDYMDEIPLYEGKVPSDTISYEETLALLDIEQLIEMVKGENSCYEFESQYGKCECLNLGSGCYCISTENWSLDLAFSDNILLFFTLRGVKLLE